MKIRIHPLFIVFLFVYTLFGGIAAYLIAFLAVFLHESAHYIIARIAGAKDMLITLMPYGAALSLPDEVEHVGAILLAGPISNLCIAAFCLAASWIIPEVHGYIKSFLTANVHIALMNLLPAYPLDGGRLLRCIARGRWARYFTSLMTLFIGFSAMILFFLGGMKNGTLLTFGIFMTTYFFAFSLERRHRCDLDAPLYMLLSGDREGNIRSVSVRKSGKRIMNLSSSEVARLVVKYDRDQSVGSALSEEGFLVEDGRRKTRRYARGNKLVI